MKKIRPFLCGLALSFGFLFGHACSSRPFSLFEAANTIFDNDKNSPKFFSVDELNAVVLFDSNPDGEEGFYSEQAFLDLRLFMAMTGFSQNDYSELLESAKAPCEGQMKRFYSCNWESDGSSRLRVSFASL